MSGVHGLTIDWETADRITAANLTEYRDTLQGQLDNYKEGGWLHPEDVVHNQKMVEAIDYVLKDFTVC
jgi:hypothetical protein